MCCFVQDNSRDDSNYHLRYADSFLLLCLLHFLCSCISYHLITPQKLTVFLPYARDLSKFIPKTSW